MPLYSADNLWESEKLKADTSDIGVDVSWREERGLRRKDTKQMQRELTESRQSKQGETWKIESFREAWITRVMLIHAWAFFNLFWDCPTIFPHLVPESFMETSEHLGYRGSCVFLCGNMEGVGIVEMVSKSTIILDGGKKNYEKVVYKSRKVSKSFIIVIHSLEVKDACPCV